MKMGNLAKKIRIYLGLDLKKRDIPLNFKFPVISHRVKARNVLGLSFYANINRVMNDQCSYFELIKERVKHLNRCTLTTRQREKLTNEVTTLFYEKAILVATQKTQTGGIPESNERRKILVLTSEICQILIISNQILFSSYYQSSNFLFERSRKKFNQSGLRIVELFCLNQQLKALRYQLHEKHEWESLCTVLLVMKSHHDISQAQQTLKTQLKIESAKSIISLFVNAVIFEHFKPLEWPTHLQWVAESYFKSVSNSVAVHFCNSTRHVERDVITVSCNANHQARFLASGASSVSSITLDCGVLFSQIRSDCLALIQAIRSKQIEEIPLRFAKFKEDERLVISHKLLNGLDHSEPYQLNNKNDQLHDLRLFVGFSEVFSLLLHQQGDFAKEERLADALAKRSAFIAQDLHSVRDTLWTLLHESANDIRLSTQESSYTTPMKIGSLVAYGIGESVKKPSLGVVSRIERTGGKAVVIDLNVISKYAEPVVVTMNYVNKDVGHRAILISSQNIFWRWGLVTQPLEVLCGVDEFSMHRKGEVFPLDLEILRMATIDFSLFSTKLSTSQLGIEAKANLATHELAQTA